MIRMRPCSLLMFLFAYLIPLSVQSRKLTVGPPKGRVLYEIRHAANVICGKSLFVWGSEILRMAEIASLFDLVKHSAHHNLALFAYFILSFGEDK